jgi:hypothetical protein
VLIVSQTRKQSFHPLQKLDVIAYLVYHKLQLDGSEMLDKIFRKIYDVNLYVACNCYRGSGRQYA